ncbi:MAG: signal peptidase I [Clostridia bacterium]
MDNNEQNSNNDIKNEDNIEESPLYNGENRVKQNTTNNKILNIISWVALSILAIICIVMICGRIAYDKVYIISGDSMTIMWEDKDENGKVTVKKTLYLNDKVVYIKQLPLQRGNVIIVNAQANISHPLIKRIVGLQGDKIWIENGYVCVWQEGAEDYDVIKKVDDAPLYKIVSSKYGNLEGKNRNNPYVVPNGCVYYMGDNRNNSTDCRDTGAIATSNILGTVKGFVPQWYILILKIKGLDSLANLEHSCINYCHMYKSN